MVAYVVDCAGVDILERPRDGEARQRRGNIVRGKGTATMVLEGTRPVVLVVEDVTVVRLDLAAHLQDVGFEVLEASNAETAIEILERTAQQVRIVLTDLKMPGSIDGLGLLHWLKAHRPQIIRAVCTALTASVVPVEEASAENLVFGKPFDPVRVSRTLEAALQSGG